MQMFLLQLEMFLNVLKKLFFFIALCFYQYFVYTIPPPINLIHFIKEFQKKIHLVLTSQQVYYIF